MLKTVLFLLAAVHFSLSVPSSCYADEDSVLIEFDRAMSSADADREKFLTSVSKWFETRENESRRRGNKDAVDAATRLRNVFNKHEILPPDAPRSLQKQQQSYREKIRSAFDTAIARYTKQKMDGLASEKQLELERLEAGIRNLPFGTWDLRYFPGSTVATTNIANDLRSYHVDNAGREEIGDIELTSDGITIRYSKFTEVWTPTPKGQELKVSHYFPASEYPGGTPSHEAIATRKQKK